MKKFGILTFHNADNLGAVLQAYALQSTFEKNFNVRAEIIDYRCPSVEQTKKAKCAGGLRGRLKWLLMTGYYQIKSYGFEKFRSRYLKRSDKTYSAQTISECGALYDAFVTGSDQVWNPWLSDHDDIYYLDFVPEQRKKYAYAASLGAYRYPIEAKEHYRRLLDRFDRISVREDSAVAELHKLGIEKVSVCPDPVFLLTVDQWKNIMPKRLCKDRYVLVYLVPQDVNVMDCAKEYARKNNCKIICNKTSLEFILHNSPSEFLSWIYYAESIFTNSFHGTALSVIMDKPLQADVELQSGGINNRVQEILTRIQAEECIISPGRANPQTAKMGEKIEELRNDAMQYLRELCEED